MSNALYLVNTEGPNSVTTGEAAADDFANILDAIGFNVIRDEADAFARREEVGGRVFKLSFEVVDASN